MKLTVALLLITQASAFPEDCPIVTPTHDVNSDKWYGGCLGLDGPATGIDTATACEKKCKGDVKCAVWQMIKEGSTATAGGCWTGYPKEGCRTRGGTVEKLKAFETDLLAGQRLQHGTPKPVNDLKGVKAEGNLLKFDFEDKESDDLKKERCKMTCYTDITCTVWQAYVKDTKFTCFVEHKPDNKMTKIGTDPVPEYIAGQQIEHTCDPAPKETPASLPWPWIIAGIVLGLLAIAAIIFFLQKKPKVKKTRAVKIEPKPTPAPMMYFIPQPTMLVPQQSVVLQQPVVQQPLMTTQVVSTGAPITTTQMTTAPTTYTTGGSVSVGVPQTAQYTQLR